MQRDIDDQQKIDVLYQKLRITPEIRCLCEVPVGTTFWRDADVHSCFCTSSCGATVVCLSVIRSWILRGTDNSKTSNFRLWSSFSVQFLHYMPTVEWNVPSSIVQCRLLLMSLAFHTFWTIQNIRATSPRAHSDIIPTAAPMFSGSSFLTVVLPISWDVDVRQKYQVLVT